MTEESGARQSSDSEITIPVGSEIYVDGERVPGTHIAFRSGALYVDDKKVAQADEEEGVIFWKHGDGRVTAFVGHRTITTRPKNIVPPVAKESKDLRDWLAKQARWPRDFAYTAMMNATDDRVAIMLNADLTEQERKTRLAACDSHLQEMTEMYEKYSSG